MKGNRETVQQVYDAFNRGDIPTVLGLMSPQVEWREPASMPFEDQVGPEAVAQNVFAHLPGMFSEIAVEVDDILDAGDAVITQGTYRGTSSRTGKRLEADFAHVWRFDTDGRISSFRLYTDTHLWLEVLGTDQGAAVPAQVTGTTAPATSV